MSSITLRFQRRRGCASQACAKPSSDACGLGIWGGHAPSRASLCALLVLRSWGRACTHAGILDPQMAFACSRRSCSARLRFATRSTRSSCVVVRSAKSFTFCRCEGRLGDDAGMGMFTVLVWLDRCMLISPLACHPTAPHRLAQCVCVGAVAQRFPPDIPPNHATSRRA